MSIKADKEAETLAEIKTLMESSDIPEDKCEDLMVKYEGREGDLLKNLRRMSSSAINPAKEDELNTTADTAAESPARSSPIKNMKGNDYQALIKAKQASSRNAGGSTKKLNYNDMIKQKKAEAAAARVATQ